MVLGHDQTPGYILRTTTNGFVVGRRSFRDLVDLATPNVVIHILLRITKQFTRVAVATVLQFIIRAATW